MLLRMDKLKLKLKELGDNKIGALEVQQLLNECRDVVGDKYIRDGKYAVIVSGGYGAGFSSWCDIKAHDPKLIDFLYENGFVTKGDNLNITNRQAVEDFIRTEITSDRQYLSGLWESHIEWIDIEDDYRIDEYDGFETLDIV